MRERCRLSGRGAGSARDRRAGALAPAPTMPRKRTQSQSRQWVHPCRPLDAPHKPVRPRLPQPDMCLLPDFGESINEALVTLPDFSPASLVPMTVQATPLAPSTVLQSVSDSVDSIVVSVSMDSVRRPQVIRFAFCVRVCLGKTCCEKIRACGHTPARLDISQKQFIYAPRSGELWCFVSGDLFLWRRR